MKKIIRLFFLMISLSLTSSSLLAAENKVEWAESIATLTSEKLDNGKWAYTIVYAIPESVAYNAKGEKILGPIKQYGVKDEKTPSPQKVKIKYRKDEPIIFEYIDKPKTEK